MRHPDTGDHPQLAAVQHLHGEVHELPLRRDARGRRHLPCRPLVHGQDHRHPRRRPPLPGAPRGGQRTCHDPTREDRERGPSDLRPLSHACRCSIPPADCRRGPRLPVQAVHRLRREVPALHSRRLPEIRAIGAASPRGHHAPPSLDCFRLSQPP